MDIFEPDPLDEQALVASLGGADIEGPGLSPELYRRLYGTDPPPTRARAPRGDIELPSQPPPSISKPPSSRDILDKVNAGALAARGKGGPTRVMSPGGTWVDRARTAMASGQRPSEFGAAAAPAAAVSGFLSKMMDNPTAPGEALREAGTRFMSSHFQAEPPSMSGEMRARGKDPGLLGGLALDIVTDPTTPLGGEADDLGRAALRGAPLLGAAMGGLKKVAVEGAEDLTEQAAVKGSAGWFPPALKNTLDEITSKMKTAQRAEWVAAGKDPKAFGPREAEIETAIKNYIRNDVSKGDPREAQRLIEGYFTTALPSDFRGVNFDARRPVEELLTHDPVGGVQFDPISKQRLDIAFDQGSQRAQKEQWGDSRWLYHLTNGDPKMAVQVTRLLGAFSPGQKTDANTLNAIEAFLRAARGESVDDILGHKIPDPGRPGKLMRQGATLSSGHPRPSTVEDNLQRAIQLGRIFNAKVEALAGAELGLHDDIPIDVWLMRAIGASSDTTPGEGAYRLISEAMAKEAQLKNENPFTYMAKVWMGMQDIVGTPTPSFAESAARLRLPGHLNTPGIGEQILGNIDYHGEGIGNKAANIGGWSPIATDPQMPFSEWEQRAQDLFRQGKQRDVLGKKTIVQTPKATTLDELRAQAADNDRLDAMMRGAQRPGSVMANMPLEVAPGAKSGVSPGYRQLSQVDKEKRDRSLLRTLLNPQGKVGVAEALFPGRTASPIAGQGYWPTPQGVERNVLNTIPIELRTSRSGQQLDPEDLRRAIVLNKFLAATFGQDALATTATQFGPTRGGKNVLRVWPSAGEKVPASGFASMSQQVPPGDWAMQHRDTGIDLIDYMGKGISRKDRAQLEQLARGAMTPEGQRGAGARLGKNIAGKVAYLEPPWGAEGSRQVTTDLVGAWRKLSAGEKSALDVEAKTLAPQVMRRLKSDPNTSPAQLNYLKIVGERGLTGLAKALKDPSQLLPVLAALGLGSTLASRSTGSPDAQ